MKVKELIAALRKMPQNLPVITQAHDNKDNEVQDRVNRVVLIDFSKYPPDETSVGLKKAVSLRS